METNTQNRQLSAVEERNLAFANLPDLSKAEVAPVELAGEYWSPTEVGEKKRVFFVGITEENVLEMETGENRQLTVVKFVENVAGDLRAIRNGSRRLVGIFEQFSTSIKPGDAFEITYLGKKKNQGNSFKSDNWSVKNLIIR